MDHKLVRKITIDSNGYLETDTSNGKEYKYENNNINEMIEVLLDFKCRVNKESPIISLIDIARAYDVRRVEEMSKELFNGMPHIWYINGERKPKYPIKQDLWVIKKFLELAKSGNGVECKYGSFFVEDQQVNFVPGSVESTEFDLPMYWIENALSELHGKSFRDERDEESTLNINVFHDIIYEKVSDKEGNDVFITHMVIEHQFGKKIPMIKKASLKDGEIDEIISIDMMKPEDFIIELENFYNNFLEYGKYENRCDGNEA